MYREKARKEYLSLAKRNVKATQLKKDRIAISERIEELKSENADTVVNFAKSWKNADYSRKKEISNPNTQSIKGQ